MMYLLKNDRRCYNASWSNLGSDIKYRTCNTPADTPDSPDDCLVDKDFMEDGNEGIDINNKRYDHGIVVLAPGFVSFGLNKHYRAFKACFGISKKKTQEVFCGVDAGAGSAGFRVEMDGEVYKDNQIFKHTEGWVTKGTPEDATCFEIRNIANVSKLILAARTIANDQFKQCALATWVNAAVLEKEPICETKGGYGPCVFPFEYKGLTIESCTTINSRGVPNQKKPWCAIEVHGERNKMKSRKWDYCGEGKACGLENLRNGNVPEFKSSGCQEFCPGCCAAGDNEPGCLHPCCAYQECAKKAPEKKIAQKNQTKSGPKSGSEQHKAIEVLLTFCTCQLLSQMWTGKENMFI